MPVPRWLQYGPSFAKNTFGRSARARRGLAACAVVLAAGGLVLFRAPQGGVAQGLALPDHPKPVSTEVARGSNSVAFSGPGAHGTLGLSHTKVLSGARQAIYAELQIRADKDDGRAVHAPLSLVVVLDTSGSMTGDKIEQAKDSVIKLIRQMDDADELSVVRYSTDAATVVPMGRVSDVRAKAIARVNELEANGGTNIPRGLSEGLEQLRETGQGRVRRVVLVSDGLDSTRTQAERLATDSFERGIVVSSLGIGLDFDESYMSSVASRGHGNFGFVNDASSLAKFLTRELDETAKTVVENATVRITLPRGVTFQRASGADVRTDAGKRGSGELELKLGSLFAGDERRVILELESNAVQGDATFEAHAAWDRIGGAHADIDVPSLSVVATADRDEVEKGRDPSVLASAVSVTASRRQMEAATAYSRGDVRTADALVEENLRALRGAAAVAPAPMATALRSQVGTYEKAQKGFHTYDSSSAPAKALSKSIVQDDSANIARKAY
ncbi:VWA domain-containing protein [Pendulispora albinea]|uniref:VWA domain-containing protein n=1 Tax=Pendulispora albinea TaxID=2741071 RepID=A0ABZ2M087_9BACT